MEPQTAPLLVVLPLTVPGCGKSTLISLISDHLVNASCQCSTVASDEIRSELMKKYSTIPIEFAIKKVNAEYNREFVRQIGSSRVLSSEIEKEMTQPITPGKSRVLFIDKNHPPDALGKSIA